MSGVHLALRAGSSRWRAPVAVALAVVATFLITALPIRASGASPFAAYRRYLITPLTSIESIQEVLLAASPLLLTGLAVAIAFRSGYYNIGAEGQFLAGAIGATVPGLYAAELSSWLALPLALSAGALAGLLWALLPAWLKRVAGIDEVVTTLLLNPVALLLLQGLLNGPWRHPESGFPDSETFGPGYELPTILGSDRVHAGLLIGIAAIAVTGVVMAATPLGLRVKAAGQAPAAARFSGIAVDRLQWRSALLSGAIAGLAGACQVLGVQHQLHRLDRRRLRLHRDRRRLARRPHGRGCPARRAAPRRHRRRRPERLADPADPPADGRHRHRRPVAHRRLFLALRNYRIVFRARREPSRSSSKGPACGRR